MTGRRAMAVTFVPHGRGGAVLQTGDYSNLDANGASSTDLGAPGGNLGFLDGSVAWKDAKKMRIYRRSRQWGNDGCWAMSCQEGAMRKMDSAPSPR